MGGYSRRFMCLRCASSHGRFVVGGGLAGQVADLKDVDGDSAAIAATSPLGILQRDENQYKIPTMPYVGV